jgi:predicted nucleotidyltransferase
VVTFGPGFAEVAFNAFFELVNGLEDMLHLDVEIVTEKQLSNPYLIEAIEKDRILLYAA